VRERRFLDIWRGSPLLQSLRRTTVESLRNGAEARPGFRCSALALIEEGDFLGRFKRGEVLAEIAAEANDGSA